MQFNQLYDVKLSHKNMKLPKKMSYQTLINSEQLAEHLDDINWAIIDCRFSLNDDVRGRQDYLQSHIPGAIYAHLNQDLSSQAIPGKTGKHPLPSVEACKDIFSHWGIDSKVQVVAYDDAGGSMAACRVWWLLRWLGHDSVAVLDGGWQKWQNEGREIRAGNEQRIFKEFIPNPRQDLIRNSEQIELIRKDARFILLDARTTERYLGLVEPIYPVAGHIPGALSAPYQENLNPDGTFRSQKQLSSHYQKLTKGIPPQNVVFYCGSGITAAHNILAMVYAGLGEARLYPGSWSEWIADPTRPIATSE